MKEGFLLVVSGPSGVGKGTLTQRLMTNRQDVVFSISVTTRDKRPMEIDGKDYHFLTVEEFEALKDKNQLLEYAKVHNNYYGTPLDLVQNHIEQGHIVLLEIDVQGAMQVKKTYPEAVLLFIKAPSMEELRRRLVDRQTEDQATIDLRVNNAKEEIKYIDQYDYIITNDDLDQAYEELVNVVEKEEQLRN